MPKRFVRTSKEEVLAKLREAHERRVEVVVHARREAREAWEIPVPLIDNDPDVAENSATSADVSVHSATSTKANLKVETGAQGVARLITVAMLSGQEIELLVQPGETVRALAERLALIKEVGRIRLLAEHSPLPEDLLVLDCVPHARVVTAVLQFGFDFPNRLDPLMEQQIRFCLELHGCGLFIPRNALQKAAFWSAAFEKPNWWEFVQHIGAEYFRIRVFSFGLTPLNETRFISYSFGAGGNSWGTVHAENESWATASVDDGMFELLVHGSDEFLEGLEAAARAKHGVEKYGAW